jgi:hypothetical protein
VIPSGIEKSFERVKGSAQAGATTNALTQTSVYSDLQATCHLERLHGVTALCSDSHVHLGSQQRYTDDSFAANESQTAADLCMVWSHARYRGVDRCCSSYMLK